MYINSVRLENIKSYVEADIQLMPGTNVICGLNGSGKTTIVEAIGFALFDYLPYKQDSFVREGEKTGTVRVRVTALDDREYEVVRNAGTRSQHYVFDVDLNERIAERGESVVDWVRTNLLDLDGQSDLAFLFQNAIGVPQGTITSEFLRAASQRRRTFDPLLGIEEYEQAWHKLRETASYLKDLMHRIDEDIRGLTAETERIPAMEEEVETCRRALKQAETQLETTRERQIISERRRADLDTLHNDLRDSKQAADMCRRDFEQCRSGLAEAQTRERQAREARDIVEASHQGYSAHEAAQVSLTDLERERQAHSRLKDELNQCQKDIAQKTAQLEHIDQQIREADEARQSAFSLQPAVEEQGRIETQLEQARQAQGRAEQIETDLAALRTRHDRLASDIDRIHAEIAELEELRGTIPDLTEMDERLAELRMRYQEAQTAVRDLADAAAKCDEVNDLITRLEEQVAERAHATRKLESLRPLVTQIPDLGTAVRTAQAEQQRLDIALQYQSTAQAQLLRRQCPLLAIQCPASGDSRWVEDSFAATLLDLETQKQEVSTAVNTVEVALREAEQAAEEARILELEARDLPHLEKTLDRLQRERAELHGRRQQLEELAGRMDDIRGAGEQLKLQLEAFRASEKRVDRIDLLRAQATDLGREREHVEKDASVRAADLQPLLDQAGQLQVLTEKLARVGNPRSEYEYARRTGETLPRLTTERAAHEASQRRLRDVEADLERQLEVYAGLEERVAEQRRLLDQNAEAHMRYVAHKRDADLLEERQAAVDVAASALVTAEQALNEAQSRQADLTRTYDAEDHERIRQECVKLSATISALTERSQNVSSTLRRQEAELARLSRRATLLSTTRSERADLEGTQRDIELIRELIRAAGPAVTEQLLANISWTANDIFCDIMDDHASELRWDRDYDIMVHRGAEDRHFSQLSGGEQMAAALSVRLASIRAVCDIDTAFFDEPTQNMDGVRRTNLAAQIERIKGFQQLLVISHDDTFEEHTDHVLRLAKSYDRTVVEQA